MRIAVLINTRDRPSELALLLQSLRTQSNKSFDIFILDDQSGTPMSNYHFLNCIFSLLREENHLLFINKTEFPLGVSKARDSIVKWALETDNYDYFLRVDDDVILESDYIDQLLEVLEEGYDFASGVTVPCSPTHKRETKFLNGVVNRVILDEEGKYVMNGDDCGIEYVDKAILPAHHFRSCALYKPEIHKKVNYCPTKLSKHGFREEQIFSYNLLLNGFKIGVNTKAKNYHQMTPSGGERFSDSSTLIKFNQNILEEFTKENKEALNKIFTKENMPTKLNLQKETNLLMK